MKIKILIYFIEKEEITNKDRYYRFNSIKRNSKRKA